MDIWIGTSGYSYTGWVGDFYARGTSSRQMLPYYARQFPLVELNFTFYRLPTAAMLARIGDLTPAGFQFLVKIPKTISHEQNAGDVEPFRRAVQILKNRGQLLGLLCQLPQSIHDKPPARRWLHHLSQHLGDLDLAVEFRHRSWANPGLEEWLEEENLDLVSVDAPKIPALFPAGWKQSGPRVYVRLHSRNAGNWYEGGADRYDYNYSDEELGEWVDAALDATARTDRTLFLFNNCHGSHAARNAQRMQALFVQRAPQFHVVKAFAPAAPVQKTLFA
jgi:uncharacterized protein YecE (DUF72 family)